VAWAPAGPERYRIYDSAPLCNPAVNDSGLNALATPSQGAAQAASHFHPSNPLVIWGIAAALTFGAMAFSTSGSVRVGKTTLRGAIGVGK
jgi:hypothetical protein